jgi:hypothetical protein
VKADLWTGLGIAAALLAVIGPASWCVAQEGRNRHPHPCGWGNAGDLVRETVQTEVDKPAKDVLVQCLRQVDGSYAWKQVEIR